jgi:hypothetical protein
MLSRNHIFLIKKRLLDIAKQEFDAVLISVSPKCYILVSNIKLIQRALKRYINTKHTNVSYINTKCIKASEHNSQHILHGVTLHNTKRKTNETVYT